MDFCFPQGKQNRGQRIFEICSYSTRKASELFDWFEKSLLYKESIGFSLSREKFDTCPSLRHDNN